MMMLTNSERETPKATGYLSWGGSCLKDRHLHIRKETSVPVSLESDSPTVEPPP